MEAGLFHQILVGAVLLIIYVGIVFEKVERSVTALAGAALLILAGTLSQEKALEHIDGNTIILLIGMMIVVGIMRTTGLFEWMAVHTAKLSKGNPRHIMVSLIWVTAIHSGILDNVTTILLIAPITLSICMTLRLKPLPFLITEAMASNIGGIATLIGDPPNIMIGSVAKLTFVDFLVNLGPPVVLILTAFTFTCLYLFRNELELQGANASAVQSLKEEGLIKNKKLLWRSLVILGLMLVGFLLQAPLHLESATVALAGAAALLVISRVNPEEAYDEVHWTTLFFFIGLFIVVGAAKDVGIIKYIADWAKSFVETNPSWSNVFTVTISAVASAVIDNIPFTATMLPVIQELGKHVTVEPLWWSLALGVGLGGNGTLIGASANLVVAGIAAKHGHPISFMYWLKYGLIMMIESIVIAAIYVFVRYHLFS